MSKAQWSKEHLKDGEHYAGILLGENGEPDQHIILLPGLDNKEFTWGEAVKAAKKMGGALPTRREQSLLFANLKPRFQWDWHWSGEQYAAAPSHAWRQGFYDSLQGHCPRSVRVPRVRCPSHHR